MSRPTRKDAGQIIRRRGGELAQKEGKKSYRKFAPHKDVKNEDRSGNVYENKGPHDTLPDLKDDISTQLHSILQRSTHILEKQSALLSLFAR